MGKENDPNDPRYWPDGDQPYQADEKALAGYQQAREQLAQFRAPVLADRARSRVFVAAFDGTWNDKDKYPEGRTNVADIYDQVLFAGKATVKAKYQAGVATQDSDFLQKGDGVLGYSYGPRMEQMYYDFCVQARKWIDENPDARISVASVGFSRGAVTAALFTRMVDERGILDPEQAIVPRNSQGLVTSMTPLGPPLVPPGKTPQVVGLFDPVATGVLNNVDVRLPPSVVSGFQITAIDERRDAFMSKQIIDPGMSADGRFLAVRVAGAHSDIGGGYKLDGLSTRNLNMMVAYLNSTLGDPPVLRAQTVPTAPEMNVIHRSEQHRPVVYTTAFESLMGQRQAIEQLTRPSTSVAGMVYDRFFSNTRDAEPRDESLNQGLRFQRVRVPAEKEDPGLPLFFKNRPVDPPRDWNQLPMNAPLSSNDDEARGKDPLLDALWSRLPPGTSREKAEEVKVAAIAGGIARADQVKQIHYKPDDPCAYVEGTVPGFHCKANLQTPAPTLLASQEAEQAELRTQALQREQFAQRIDAMRQQSGPQITLT